MNEKPVISRLYIDSYRGIHDLMLDNLSQVNILAGANNCGKTSVLEAVQLMRRDITLGDLVRLTAERVGRPTDKIREHLIDYMLTMFHATDSEPKIYDFFISAFILGTRHRLQAEGEIFEVMDSSGKDKKELRLTLSMNKNDDEDNCKVYRVADGRRTLSRIPLTSNFESTYLSIKKNDYLTASSWLSNAYKRGDKSSIVNVLQSFDPEIQSFSVMGEDIYLEHEKNRPLPLFAYGTGTQKAALLAAAVGECRDGVMMVDEIDNSIHTSEYDRIFGWFLDMCIEYNIQAFITTHSAEALDAILNVAHRRHRDEDLLRVITLRKDEKANVTRKLVRTGEEAYEDRVQFEQELRV